MPLVLPTPDQVAILLARPLSDESESQLATQLISNAAVMLRGKVKSLDAQIDAGKINGNLATQIVANAVARVLRNPDGYRSESMGGVGFTLDTRVAAGFLLFTSDELSQLGVGGIRSIGIDSDAYARQRMSGWWLC